MRAVVVVDNNEGGGCSGEWGLSIHIEYKGKNILLDTGASDLFLTNMEKLGLRAEEVDFGVLSHAHFDHGNGMPAFFEKNSRAVFYVQQSCGENCYSDADYPKEYIGLPKGLLEKYENRICRVARRFSPFEGVTLLGHSTPDISFIGKREQMYIMSETEKYFDDFSHEQSLIFETEKGLVVFSSCSHAGADAIINEVLSAFPGKKIEALIGGFHLYNKTEDELRSFAEKLKAFEIPYICTGHCTGNKAYLYLKEVLGDSLHKLHAGLRMELMKKEGDFL